MKYVLRVLTISAVTILGASVPLSAQSNDFNLTYYVERTPEVALDIETCGSIVEEAAAKAGYEANVQRFPGQLILVSGGKESQGVFTVQCIEVEKTTVSVVQGIDYRNKKAALGQFADDVQAAIMAAKK